MRSWWLAGLCSLFAKREKCDICEKPLKGEDTYVSKYKGKIVECCKKCAILRKDDK